MSENTKSKEKEILLEEGEVLENGKVYVFSDQESAVNRIKEIEEKINVCFHEIHEEEKQAGRKNSFQIIFSGGFSIKHEDENIDCLVVFNNMAGNEPTLSKMIEKIEDRLNKKNPERILRKILSDLLNR